QRELLERYVDAFQRYDMSALTALIHEDATQSMPPYEMWLSGRGDILGWWVGPGAGCSGSRLVATVGANGSPAFGQYKPGGPDGRPRGGYGQCDSFRSRPVDRRAWRNSSRIGCRGHAHEGPRAPAPPRLRAPVERDDRVDARRRDRRGRARVDHVLDLEPAV